MGNQTAANTNQRHLETFRVDSGMLISELPDAPDDLDSEGEKWWKYYGGLMVEGRIFSRMFLGTLHNLCIMHMIRKMLQNELDRNGGIMCPAQRNIGGVRVELMVMNPIVRDLEEVISKMTTLFGALGMTVPTSKANNIDTGSSGPRTAGAPPPFTPENQQDVDLGEQEILQIPGLTG